MSTRFYYGQKDYIIQLNLMDDAFQAGPYSALPLAGGTLTGPVISSAGSVGTPSVGIGAANSGFYRPAANQIGMSINGINVATLTSSGLTLATALSIANGGTGATTAAAALTALAGATTSAALIGNAPAGNIAATNVQAAINELDTEKAKLNGDSAQDFAMLSLNGGPVAGFRNVLINGKFNIWQRGTSFTVAAGVLTYTADRWCIAFSGSGNGTIARSLFGTGAGPSPLDTGACVVTQIAGMANSTLRQRVEGVATLNGNSVTLSLYAINASGSTTLSCSLTQNFGTGGSPSADVITNLTGTATLTGGYVKYTFTGTIPSISGKSLGTNGNDFLELQIVSSSNSACSWAVTGVQLEQGAAATPFERRPQGVELALCQRYFCKTFPYATAPANNTVTTGALFYGGNGTSAYHTVRWEYPVTMRAAPSYTFYNTATGAAGTWRDVANSADSTPGIIANGDKSLHVALASASVYTAAVGSAWYIHVAASAEL